MRFFISMMNYLPPLVLSIAVNIQAACTGGRFCSIEKDVARELKLSLRTSKDAHVSVLQGTKEKEKGGRYVS